MSRVAINDKTVDSICLCQGATLRERNEFIDSVADVRGALDDQPANLSRTTNPSMNLDVRNQFGWCRLDNLFRKGRRRGGHLRTGFHGSAGVFTRPPYVAARTTPVDIERSLRFELQQFRVRRLAVGTRRAENPTRQDKAILAIGL